MDIESASVPKGRLSRDEKLSATALFVISVALLLVGMVSGTVIRHAAQGAPVLAAGVLVSRGIGWSRCAALPVLAFWLFIMALIWLHLVGLAHVVTGRFTATEVGLTLVIGISAVVGLVASLRSPNRSTRSAGWIAILLFGAIQIGAMWLSLRPMMAGR